MSSTNSVSTTAKNYAYADLKKLLALKVDAGPRGRKSKSIPTAANQPSAIAPGSRNNTLTSLAGSLRRLGLNQEQMSAVLGSTNQVMTSDPLDAAEVESIATSVARYEPSNPGAILQTCTDTGNADRFARKWCHNVRFVPEWRQWLMWDGMRWRVDGIQQVVELAKTTAREILLESAAVADQKLQLALATHAFGSQKLERLRAMVKLAESIPELIVRSTDLDKDRMLLGVRNGTLDLKTGALRPSEQNDYMTRQCPVTFDADAKCPTFLKFLATVTAQDQELIDYIQRAMGYCLTGDTTEQCLFFFYGSGANGKSTLLNVIKELLGPDYCRQTPADTLMVKTKGGGATNDIARLEGVRVALSNEVEEGSRLGETMVKQLTGNDPVAARYLYKEFFEYIPQFKLIIAGNHQPVIRGADEGIWRRLHLVPFTVTIPLSERDHKLADKLRAELPGIINFAVAGCRQWQTEKLAPPAVIQDAVAEYKAEMDVLGQWIEENCTLAPEHTVSASTAYDDYKRWALANGYFPLSANTFGRRLKEKHPRKRTNAGAFYTGLRTKNQVGHQ